MNSGYFIAGEWGSTFMRLYLCDQSDGHFKILTEAHGTGVMSTKDFEDAFSRQRNRGLTRMGIYPLFCRAWLAAISVGTTRAM